MNIFKLLYLQLYILYFYLFCNSQQYIIKNYYIRKYNNELKIILVRSYFTGTIVKFTLRMENAQKKL